MSKATEKLAKLRHEKEKLEKLATEKKPGLKVPTRTKKKFNLLKFFKFPKKSASSVPKSGSVEPKKAAVNKAPPTKDSTKSSEEKKPAKKKKERITSYQQRKRFSNFINKAGIDADFNKVNRKIMIYSVIPIIFVDLFVFVETFVKETFIFDAMSLIFSITIFGSLALYFLLWILLFVYVDIIIYQRRKDIEAVFPDFLQLTAANINAGMPIDRALWFAIRPRFGILAKEMETVAKSTMVGEKLHTALIDFSNRYDSISIKRSINLLLEGLESGGEIGDLLVRVASNMRETEIIKKEMASNVTTYVIFILFATLGAGPFLFGLTTELIVIMKSILSNINIDSSGSGGGGLGGGFSISGDAISVQDYQIFALASICISSIFAAIIISVIQKGNAKESLRNIPVYMLVGITVYFIAFSALSIFLGGFFG